MNDCFITWENKARAGVFIQAGLGFEGLMKEYSEVDGIVVGQVFINHGVVEESGDLFNRINFTPATMLVRIEFDRRYLGFRIGIRDFQLPDRWIDIRLGLRGPSWYSIQ